MPRPRRRPDGPPTGGPPTGGPAPAGTTDRTSRRPLPPLTGRSMLGAALVVASVGAVLAAHRAAVAPGGVPVLLAAREVRAGTTLTADDLLVTRVDLPSEVATVPGEDASSVVGATATRDLARGALLTGSDVAERGTAVPSSGRVSLSVPAERTPVDLRAGVRVDVLATDVEQGTTDLVLSGATVTATGVPTEGSIGGGGPLLVEVAVPDVLAAAALVDASVRHQVTLVLPAAATGAGVQAGTDRESTSG